MKISLSKIARIKTLKSPFPLECPKSFKLLKQFRQAKSQVLKQQRSLRTLINFDFGHLLILLALRRRLLTKISSILVSGPNITVDFRGVGP